MDFQFPAALQELMEHLKGLPGIGKRSAERMALSIFQWAESRLAAWAENLRTAIWQIRPEMACVTSAIPRCGIIPFFV